MSRSTRRHRWTPWRALAMAPVLILFSACSDTLTEPAGIVDDQDVPGIAPQPSFAYVGGGAWNGSGPGSVTLEDGANGDPSLTYALSGWSGTWSLSSTATQTGSLEVDYDYAGFHSWCGATVYIDAFITRGGATTSTRLAYYQDNCSYQYPSGGFHETDSYTFDLQAGDVYGFSFGGSHGDSNYYLGGTFTLSQPVTVYTSGSGVTTWDPIVPATMPADWAASICTTQPGVSLDDPRWVNPHNAFEVGHGWAGSYFTAPWINAWNHNQSYGSGGPSPYHNWTKYSTTVSGDGDFIVQLLADNCSWIYLDEALVGVQDTDLSKNTYPVSLSGDHELTFIIYDGGVAAGGKFRLETYDSYVDNGGDPGDIEPPPVIDPDSDGDGVPDSLDAFPNDPTESVDTDGDGHGDNGDAFPNDPTEWADTDGDGHGDNGDAFPSDPTEWADTDGDGHGDNGDAFPTDPTEWADTDGDGYGDNGDTFPNSDLNGTVAFLGCSTSAANHLFSSGATFNDLIGQAYDSARNHGQFVNVVAQLSSDWKNAGLISGKEKGQITSCAAKTK